MPNAPAFAKASARQGMKAFSLRPLRLCAIYSGKCKIRDEPKTRKGRIHEMANCGEKKGSRRVAEGAEKGMEDRQKPNRSQSKWVAVPQAVGNS
jgi:hypothetical protein